MRAGWGRYLGYIADEMSLGLHELGPMAETSRRPVKINSTCTVFAGAEVRDRFALGEKREDILAGLHRAVILRAMSLLARAGGSRCRRAPCSRGNDGCASRVGKYKMTSQCASGSAQFLVNISRYLGVSQSDIGKLSLAAGAPEKVSSICAVLAETDVINMVSRGISTPDILRGVHDSMAGRAARLLQALGAHEVVFASGGLAADKGLLETLRRALAGPAGAPVIEVVSHRLSVQVGAIGAALWGAFRHAKLGLEDVACSRAGSRSRP